MSTYDTDHLPIASLRAVSVQAQVNLSNAVNYIKLKDDTAHLNHFHELPVEDDNSSYVSDVDDVPRDPNWRPDNHKEYLLTLSRLAMNPKVGFQVGPGSFKEGVTGLGVDFLTTDLRTSHHSVEESVHFLIRINPETGVLVLAASESNCDLLYWSRGDWVSLGTKGGLSQHILYQGVNAIGVGDTLQYELTYQHTPGDVVSEKLYQQRRTFFRKVFHSYSPARDLWPAMPRRPIGEIGMPGVFPVAVFMEVSNNPRCRTFRGVQQETGCPVLVREYYYDVNTEVTQKIRAEVEIYQSNTVCALQFNLRKSFRANCHRENLV